jgi:transposase
MDDPNRITKSKAAGALFGLTPRKYQSGEKDVTSGITRAGARRSMKPPIGLHPVWMTGS